MRNNHYRSATHLRVLLTDSRYFVSSLVALLCLLCSGAVGRAQSLNYELRDCIERGLQNNYQLQIVRNQEQMARNNATWANAGALPTLDATAALRPTYHNFERSTARATDEVTENDNVLDYTLDASASLSWTLFDGFKIQTNHRQLKLLEQQGETATRMAVEDLIADITSEYYNYIQQIIRRAHYRYALNLSRERLRIAELNYQTGRFSGLDYHQARVDFHSDSSAYVRQREVVHASRIRLNTLMANHDVDQRIVVPDSSIRVRDDLLLESLWQQTLDANASLINAAQNTMLAEQDLRKVQSRNYPYLRLNTQYGYTANHYDINSTRERETLGFTGGLTLGINLWDGNRRRERRNAELGIQNRQLQRQQLELELHARLTTFWMSYRNNLDLLQLQRENLEIAENNLEIAMERYKLGNLSGFDMRQVQKALLDAEERVLQVEYDAKLCEISLLLISGGISWYLE